MTGASWYNTGYDGIEREKDRIARLSGPNRYWMKEGTRREIVFIDDEPICVHEHNPKMNGKFTNWLTCLQETNPDNTTCCDKLGARTRYYVGYYTVVDLTENKDSKGNSYQYEVKLFPAKLKSLQVMRRKKADRGSLIGCVFGVFRDTQDDPNCGNEFEFKKEADLDRLFKVANYKGKKLPELYAKAMEDPASMKLLKETFQVVQDANGLILPKILPFNYINVLAPKDPKEVRSILGSYKAEDSGGKSGGNGGGEPSDVKDDEVPF